MADTPNNVPHTGVNTPPLKGRGSGTLLVMYYLRQGISPAEMWKKDLIPRRTVDRSLQKLLSVGAIKKVGYGTWEIVAQKGKEERMRRITHRVAITRTLKNVPKNVPLLKTDDTRAHGVVATVRMPKIVNWTNPERETILSARKIPFITLGGNQGQRIGVGHIEKVWLTNNSIVIYYPKGTSWFAKKVKDAAAAIMEDTIKIVLRLERMLGIATIKINGYYWIKFSRQHDSLIKNALAKMYNKPRQKIVFRDTMGQWGHIDNSWNLEELETTRGEREYQPIDPRNPIREQIRSDDGARDHNKKIVGFFNGVKDTGITPEFILETFAKTAIQIKESHGQLAFYAKNLETHVGAVNNLASQASENAKSTVTLREAVTRLAETMRTYPMPTELAARLPAKAKKRLETRISKPIQEEREKKPCGLCGQRENIPISRDLCDTCENMIKARKKPSRESTLGEYVDT